LKKSDYVVTAAFISTFLWFSINALYPWIGWLYINVLISGGALAWAALRWDAPGYIREGAMIGFGSAFIYLAVNGLLVRVALILDYLRKDVLIFYTPLSVILTWGLMITLAIYLYRRMREFIGNFYLPALVIGILAFAVTLGLNELGNIGRLWNWNMLRVPRPILNSTPFYVLIANFLVPFAAPYILGGNPIIEIFRCGVTISVLQLLCFVIFRMLFFSPL